MSRSDDDTGDLASSVVATATAVAARGRPRNRAAADRRSRCRTAGPRRRHRASSPRCSTARSRDGRRRPRSRMSRMTDDMAVRTRFFDDSSAQRPPATGHPAGGDPGLGAGLAGYRLPWPAGTVVFEIDQPEVIDVQVRTLAELGATADRRAAHRRRRPARRLAGGAARGRASTRHAPDRVERRGPAGLSAAGRPGPAAGHITECRPRAAGWPPSTTPMGQRDRRPRLGDERAVARHGLDLNLAELFYAGERSHGHRLPRAAGLAGQHACGRRCSPPAVGHHEGEMTAGLRTSLSVTAIKE